MSDDTAALILALATENAELRAALAEAQDLLVETAVDAGELHARVEELQAEIATLRATMAALAIMETIDWPTSDDDKEAEQA